MPDDWAPTKHDVIIGRGKKVYHHAGNQKLRDLVKVEVDAYSQAKNRAAKSIIIIRIFNAMRVDTDVGFVKKDPSNKKYYAVEDTAAKIAIAQYFRDALADGYKSSRKYKQKLRDEMKRSVSDIGQHSESMDAKALKRSASAGDALRASAPMSEFLFGNDNSFEVFPVHLRMKMARTRCNPPATITMLQQASDFLEEQDECPFPDIEVEETNLRPSKKDSFLSNNDAFVNLYRAFGTNINHSCDPFEPTPLRESSCFPVISKYALDDPPPDGCLNKFS
jgi:hypothetical protein